MTAAIVLWRHGQTDYNAAGRLQGQIDIPLNNTGREQADTAARALAELNPTAIITSDLSRAADTAATLAHLVNIDLFVDTRLRERSFGDWEGLTRAEIQHRWPKEFEVWRDGGQPEGINSETREQTGVRFAEAINEWSKKYEISDTLVFVAHGAAISTGITSLLNQNPDEWRGISGLTNCHWSILEPTNGAPKWRLLHHNVGP